MSVARGLNCHAYACISFTETTKLNRPPISNHMPSRHHHPVISIWSQTSKSDVGEQWHTISNSNSAIPFHQHTIPICIQRARDSGHAAPRAPRARDELAPLALRALLSCKQLSTKVPGRFYSTLHFRYRIHLYGARVHSGFTWPK